MKPGGRGSTDRAVDLALRFFALRDRTEKEIRLHLGKNGVTPSDVQSTLERLKRWGYVDDERTALGWARGKIERAHWGPARLTRHLMKRGVGSEVIERVLEAALEDMSEEELARGAAKRYLLSHAGNRGRRGMRRLAGYLGRRGYSGEVIGRILYEQQEYCDKLHDEDDHNTDDSRRAS